jgi:hypothetical protein
MVLGAGLLGLFIGVAWALAADGLARISRNPAESERLQTLRRLLAFRKRARV